MDACSVVGGLISCSAQVYRPKRETNQIASVGVDSSQQNGRETEGSLGGLPAWDGSYFGDWGRMTVP
jgi:hypothetical protein